jgi:ATP-dependent 26S proteasome regulatory subunit
MPVSPLQRIRKGLLARYTLIYVRCDEESRLEAMLSHLLAERGKEAGALKVWSSTRGLLDKGEPVAGTENPLDVLRHILASKDEAFYLLKDFPGLLEDPALARGLRDMDGALAGRDVCVFLSYPGMRIPETLAHQVFVVDLGMPAETDIREYLQAAVIRAQLGERISPAWISRAASAMKGMALSEVGHLMNRLLAEGKLDMSQALPEIHEEKAAALLKEGCLKFIPHTVAADQVGGLENLKEWIAARKALFTRAALEAGVPMPAGVLFTGVSGCGKSMAAKVIAGAWELPLVRLDMNLVMSGAFGTPEYAFDHALRVVENMAPLVLWIDEMENSFGYDEGSSGNNQNIFSSFLTWMQEKPGQVFVVATANRIEKLPAEVIRKGRFDQLFFLDLPTETERRAILTIHIRAYGGDPAGFNLNYLVAATKGWSGAEIEQAIKGAVIHAYPEQRPFNDKDVIWNTARIVPLSKTMDEQIKALRQWSLSRATPASSKEGT